MNEQIQQLLAAALSGGSLGVPSTTSIEQTKNQRSPQVINIISEESQVSVNIGNLLPNFYSFNQDINLYYQIKSITFPTNFFNVKATDQIYFSCVLTMMDLRTFTPITWTCTPTTFIQFEKDGYMNAEEIIKQWNWGIQNKAQIFKKIISQITNNFQLTHDELFYGVIMNHIQFSFDSGVMKLCMKTDFRELDITYPPEPLNWDPNENLDNFRQNFILTGIDYFNMYTGYGQSFKESGRIAKALGMGYTDGFSTYYQPFFDVIDYTSVQDSTTLLQTPSFDTEVFNLQYGTNMCNVNRYDKIFIRTSLNTQNWNPDGSRSNVLAIIPFQQTVGMLPMQMTQSERTYNIKETPQSLSAFQIYFTDEDNEMIEFNDKYMIELAFFYV